MGVDAINITFLCHGMDTTGAKDDVEVTIHYGNKSIDETHDMGRTAHNLLRAAWADNNQSAFNTTFGTWYSANASSAALPYKTAAKRAAWRA